MAAAGAALRCAGLGLGAPAPPQAEAIVSASSDARAVRFTLSIRVTRCRGCAAALRLLLVEPKGRGRRVGTRLFAECVAFARAVGYGRVMLWTNSVLDDARRIYERAGFRLGEQERHRSFGGDLVGQNWELRL